MQRSTPLDATRSLPTGHENHAVRGAMSDSEPVAELAASAVDDESAASAQRTIVKNTLLLGVAQAASLPISILLSAITARFLGPEALGSMYLGSTFNSFGALVVDWGQGGALPAMVATDRSSAGRLLGTSLVWRCAWSLAVGVVLALVCQLFGYSSDVKIAIALMFVGYTLSAFTNAYQLITLGFERADISAYRQVLEPMLSLVIVAPILLLGGQLAIVLWGHALGVAILLAYVWRASKSTPLQQLSFDRASLRALLQRGTPFVFLTFAAILQPNIDAIFLSKLAPEEVVGWLAAARKLVGVLIFPSAALIGAAYPTLCRLYAEDTSAFQRTTSAALRATTLLAVPVALCCALFPEIGVTIYSRKSFVPAEDDLRILAIFLFLVYFSMPLGTALQAAGKSRKWAAVQALCVVVSVVLDPILIPYFQRRTGNGGMGVCVSAVVSETIVVLLAVQLAPRGIFERRFWRSLLLAGVSGLAMAAVARALSFLSPFLVAPCALATYVLVLWLTGGLEPAHIEALRSAVTRKLSRLRRARNQ